MSWLFVMGLTNAVLATLLAAIAVVVARLSRWPALAHALWIVVLLKLLTPPVVEIPVGWTLDLSMIAPPAAVDHGSVATSSVGRTHSGSMDAPTDARQRRAPSPGVSEANTAAAIGRGFESQPPDRAGPMGVETSITPATGGTIFTAWSYFWSRALVGMLPGIWLGGAVVTLTLLLRQIWQFGCFLGAASQPDAGLALRIEALARRVGLSTAPQVVVIDSVIAPMLWGAGRGTLLLFPARLARELGPPACDTLLLHELAHYSRGDQWVRLVELIARVLFWWHPIVWWARREIELAEEQCCDAWVVEHQSGTRRSYAEALLAAIDFLSEQAAPLPPAASRLGDVPFLKIRLIQIMRGEMPAALPLPVRLSISIAALAILPVAPAVFGAHVQRPRLPHSASIPAADVRIDWPASESSVPSSDGLALPPSTAVDTTLAAITRAAAAAPRPASVLSARAISPNGRFQLERRRGVEVTLVDQATDFRLNMTDHHILCAAFTVDSRLFVTGHGDSQIRVWDSQTGGYVSSLKGSSDAIWSVAVTKGYGSEYVAGGAQDGSVIVWNLKTGDEVARLPAAGVAVSCLRWSHNGDKLAISFGDFSERDESALMVWSPWESAASFHTELEAPAAALAWLPSDESLVVADWTGDAQAWPLNNDGPPYRVTLGTSGKQLVEAAHWSSDCPLIPAWLTQISRAGAE